MYQLTQIPNQVKRLSDSVFISFELENGLYLEYLEWLAEGNTPLTADEVTQ